MSGSQESGFWQEDRSSSSGQSFEEKDENSKDSDRVRSSCDDQQGIKIVQDEFDRATKRNSDKNREFHLDSFYFQWETSTQFRSQKRKLERKKSDTASLLQRAKRFCSDAGISSGSSNQNSAGTLKQVDGINVPELERVTKLRANLIRLAGQTASNSQAVPTSNDEKTSDVRNVILIDNEAGQPKNNALNAPLNDDNWHSTFYERVFDKGKMDHNKYFRAVRGWGKSDSVTSGKGNSSNLGSDRYRLLNKVESNKTNRMQNTGTNYSEKHGNNSETIEDKGELPRDYAKSFYSGVHRRHRRFQGGYSVSNTEAKQISKSLLLQHNDKKPVSNGDGERLATCSERRYSMSSVSPNRNTFQNENGAMQVAVDHRNTNKGSQSHNASKGPFRFSTCTMSHDDMKDSQCNAFPYRRQRQSSNNERIYVRTTNDDVEEKRNTPARTFVNNEVEVNSRANDQTSSTQLEAYYDSCSSGLKIPATCTSRYQGISDHSHRLTNMMYEETNGDATQRHSSYPLGHASSAFQQRRFAAKQNSSYLHNRAHKTKVNEQSKSDLPSVCYKEDFDSNCFWKHVKFNNISPHGRNQSTIETFYVSSTEPVITVVSTHESKSFAHHHIHDPLYKSPYQVGRKLVPVQLPEKICDLGDGFDFTVLSYNVLSDDLLWQNKSLYHGCPEWVLGWQYRKKSLLKEIITYNADVLCLQEVQADHYYHWFLPKLHEHGYVGVYKQRTGDKPDGCATFYRSDRFTQRQLRHIEYKIRGNSIMDRDNVGLILALDPIVNDEKSNKPAIFIANTHLLFNKSRGDIKLLQLARLLAEIDDMAKVESNLPQNATSEDVYNPVIICGDFNSMPHSPLYKLITEGKLKYQGKSRVHISGQHSQHKHASEDTYFQNRLIPNGINISHLCRKKEPQTDFSRDVNETEDNTSDSDDDCVIVGEKVCGKIVMMEEPGVLKHLLQLRSAYKHPYENDKQTVTTCHGTVDYIMFSQGVEKCISETLCSDGDIFVKVPRKQLYLTGLLNLLSKDDLHAMNKVPNTHLSSDHLALLASFRLFE